MKILKILIIVSRLSSDWRTYKCQLHLWVHMVNSVSTIVPICINNY